MSARPIGVWLMAAAGVAVAGTIVAAIGVLGSPSHQRDARFDERRVRELTALKIAIDAYGRSEKRLPASLADLHFPDGRDRKHADPQTRQPYEYRAIDARHYELCATFVTEQLAQDRVEPYFDADWEHPAGRHCFRHALSFAAD